MKNNEGIVNGQKVKDEYRKLHLAKMAKQEKDKKIAALSKIHNVDLKSAEKFLEEDILALTEGEKQTQKVLSLEENDIDKKIAEKIKAIKEAELLLAENETKIKDLEAKKSDLLENGEAFGYTKQEIEKLLENESKEPENISPEVTTSEEPKVVTEETTLEQVDLKEIESALKKIKNNPAYIEARVLELVKANCPADEAQKIAEYEEMIRMNSERKELLEKGLGLKDRETRIAKAQGTIDETTLKLNELKSKNNIQEIKVAETQKNKVADQKDIEKIILSLENNILEVENLLKTINPEYKDEKIYLQSKLNSLQKKIEVIKEINLDRQEKPFLYYSIEKSNNPLILANNTNIYGLLDLRLIENDWRNIQHSYLKETGENEGYFHYDQFGFVKIIKNVNEVRSDKGINYSSEKTIYKIIGPNGEIIADDIVGYSKEEEIYNQKTNEYEEKIRKEYDENPNTSEKIAGLDNLEAQIETELLDLKNRCAEIQVEIKKTQKLEELYRTIEERRQAEFENGPLTLRMKKNVMTGLNAWENFGQNEVGWKGFGKRMTKTTINLAMVGAISLLSIDQLAKHGIISAATVGTGSIASRLGSRMISGLGFATIMDIANKKVPDNVKKWLPVAISTGMAVIIGGFGWVAVGAGVSAYAGIKIAEKIRGTYASDKVVEKKEEATQKLLKKYGAENGTIDLSRVPEFEKEYHDLIVKFENQGIKGKLLDEGAKILTASVISTTLIGVSSFVRDHFGHSQSNVETEKELPVKESLPETSTEMQDHTDQIEQPEVENEQTSENTNSPDQKVETDTSNEISVNSPDESPKDSQQTDQAILPTEDNKITTPEVTETRIEHQTEQIKVAMVHQGGSYERSFIHQIEADPKLATDLGYKGDINDVKALHEFAGREAHLLALRTGIVDSEGRQLGILEAEKVAPLIRVENGCVSIEDTTLDGKIVNVHNEGDTFGEHLSKNEYVMKDHEIKIESNKDSVSDQYNSSNEPMINPRAAESDNNTSDSQAGQNESALYPMAAIQAQEENNIQHNQNNPDLPKQEQASNLDHKTDEADNKTGQNEDSPDKDTKPHDLTHREIRQVERIHNHNINKIFPDNYNDGAWHKVEDSNAYKLFNAEIKDLSSEGKALHNYLHKLSDLTGFTPLSEDPSHDSAPETNKHFINDALVAIAKEGKLDDIKL